MLIKDILNEYELDWASLPYLPEEFDFSKLKNKTFLVSGQKFARSIVYTLLTLNENENLNLKIILTGSSQDILKDYHPELLKFSNFEFINLNRLNTSKKIDYIIDTGYCGTNIKGTTEEFKKEIKRLGTVLNFAGIVNPKKFIFISDYRVYGNGDPTVLYSEKEYVGNNISSYENCDTQLMTTLESLCSTYSKQYNFPLITFRTGVIIGAKSKLDHSFKNLFKAVAQGEEVDLINSKRKYTFVYISDVLKGIITGITSFDKSNLYNIGGKNSTISTGMLSAMLFDLFYKDVKINLVPDDNTIKGVSINSDKLEDTGCIPEITISDGLDLCVKSYKKSNVPFVFTGTYQGKLKPIHNILMQFLLETDRICKKHNIKYFLAGGTLLGAIRHKGFIPWDDDADIMMLREDYEKFLLVAPKELPKNVTMQNNRVDKNDHNCFTRLRIDNTMFSTKWTNRQPHLNNGVFFDILCHDVTANSSIGQKLHMHFTILTRSMVFNKWYKRRVDNGSKIPSAIVTFIKNILPLRFLDWLQEKSFVFFKNKKNPKYLYDGMGRNIRRGAFPKEYLDYAIHVEFNGHKLPVPKKYDKYLQYLYGDYNQLVPASQRQQSHSIVLCDLGEYNESKKF